MGSIPHYRNLRQHSGSTNNYVDMEQYTSVEDFLEANRSANIVVAELTDEAVSIHNYDFTFLDGRETIIVVGNETTGVPGTIISQATSVYVPMPGPGSCLNTAQTANILLYEAIKQYEGLV
jgi:tRNA(Leu) C34 or U34 (ribose-2'-O)-methylase TrmL